MIKRPVCRKLPGDLSVFLNQPQMVHSLGWNTRKLCFFCDTLSLTRLCKQLHQRVFYFFLMFLGDCTFVEDAEPALLPLQSSLS